MATAVEQRVPPLAAGDKLTREEIDDLIKEMDESTRKAKVEKDKEPKKR